MKFVLPFLLITFLITLSFGFLGGSHAHGYCFASLINSKEAPCPERDILGFVDFHLSALQFFSLANLIVFFFFSLVVLLFSLNHFTPTFYSRFAETSKNLVPEIRLSFLSWVALYENSPNIF